MQLDLTGALPDNKRVTTHPVNYKQGELAIITPQFGFFHTSMASPVITYLGKQLVYGIDYRYIYGNRQVRDKYKISSHGSILILNNKITGQVTLEASYLGKGYQLYTSGFVSDITSTDYLLSLYSLDSLTDLPENLPPRASLLDMEHIETGMVSTVQMVFGLAECLKNVEIDKSEPSTGHTWPDINITDL